jgi:hypothetical protein
MLKYQDVDRVFRDCLLREGEDGERRSGYVAVEGKTTPTLVGFHPGRLESHRKEIIAMLNDLPAGFRKSAGLGGLHFIAAGTTKYGRVWDSTDSRVYAQELVMLGMALGKIKHRKAGLFSEPEGTLPSDGFSPWSRLEIDDE